MTPRSAARDNASPIQMLLMEHFASTAMWQLNEIRLVVGLPTDTPHKELLVYLRGLSSARTAAEAPRPGIPGHPDGPDDERSHRSG